MGHGHSAHWSLPSVPVTSIDEYLCRSVGMGSRQAAHRLDS